MARPTPNTIASGQQSWDADINDNTDTIFAAPFPPFQVADLTALNLLPAASYDRCVAATVTPPAIWYSTGAAWRRMVNNNNEAVANQAALTAVAGTGDDVTINANFSALVGKVNDLLAKVRSSGLLNP